MTGRKREKRDYEAPDMAAFMNRTMRAMVRRAADGDQEVLSALVDVRAHLDEALRDSARALNARGKSWAYIGNELGMTRQSAYERFADRATSPARAEQPADQLTIDSELAS